MPIPTPVQRINAFWEVTPSQGILPRVRQFLFGNVFDRLQALMAQRADEIEAWMQANAPWQDRTGVARETLRAEIEVVYGEGVSILMSYGDIGYSLWLEVMQGGRFSILGPALDHWRPIINNDIRRIVGG